PRPQLPADEDAVLTERVAAEDLLRVLLRRRLVDDQGAAVVGERTRSAELALRQQRAQILAVSRTDLLDLVAVLDVLDGGSELHDGPPGDQCETGTAARRRTLSSSQAWAPNSRPVKSRSPNRTLPRNPSGGASGLVKGIPIA